MPDHRSELAKARDAFLESPEGESVCDTSILYHNDDQRFLRNRIERAFIAGWTARERATTEKGSPDGR